MTRNEELLEYVDSLYIPKDKLEKIANLKRIIRENDYRAIDVNDQGKMFLDSLVIVTKGNPPRETFDYYLIARVDVGEATGQYADIAIFDFYAGHAVTPKRIKRTSKKISLLAN